MVTSAGVQARLGSSPRQIHHTVSPAIIYPNTDQIIDLQVKPKIGVNPDTFNNNLVHQMPGSL